MEIKRPVRYHMGNLMIRLPKDVTDAINVSDNDTVIINITHAKKGELKIKFVKEKFDKKGD